MMFKHLYFQSKHQALITGIATSTLGLSLFLTNNNTTCDFSIEEEEETRNFRETLRHHKRHLSHYKQSWDWQNVNSRIPTVSWPLNIPSESEVPSLQTDLIFCHQRSNPNDENSRYCSNLQFRIASHLLLQPDVEVQKQGLKLIQQLAEQMAHPDSICAYATCLNEGRGGITEPNPSMAVSWWKHAATKYHHIQSMYEMGVALYTGEGVAEDERTAVEYFRQAAESGHAGASYMLGDCLLDGVGVERDRGEALEWLVTAAELGHRGARSRVLAVLEKKEGVTYGEFTDASRQTLITHDDDEKKEESSSSSSADSVGSADSGYNSSSSTNVETAQQTPKDKSASDYTSGTKRDSKEKLYSNRPVTLEHRFTIGGGARNPVVLARRRTIVYESRQHE